MMSTSSAAVAAMLALATAASLPAQGRQTAANRLDAFVSRGMGSWHGVGLAVAVVKDGNIVFAKGYGVRRLGDPAPVDTATLFAIGSTTKAMVAAGIGLLVDSGKVRWNDPVIRYLPGFRVADPYVTRELTVRDVLTHRWGVPNVDYLWYESGYDTDEILRRMRLVGPAYSFRSSFIYQNIGYVIAGEIIRAVTGMSWQDFLRTRLLDPIGMTATVFDADDAARSSDVAWPHWPSGDSSYVIANPSLDGAGAAGAIWSSISDMARWVRFALDTGQVGGHPLLTPGTWREWLRSQQMIPESEFYPTAALTHPHYLAYAHGWFREDYDGRDVAFHTGSIDGMVAIVGLIPDERLGVVVLANRDHLELRHAIMYRAFDLWKPEPRDGGSADRDWNSELLGLYEGLRHTADSAEQAQQAKRVPGTAPSLALAAYAGTYADSLFGTVTVREEGDTLRIRLGRLQGTLGHWQYDQFLLRYNPQSWIPPAIVRFELGVDGIPTRMVIEDWPRHFERQEGEGEGER